MNRGRCCAKCKTPYGCARHTCTCHSAFVELNTQPAVDPDCQQAKHTACPGWTFDTRRDDTTPCMCPCHIEDAA